MARTVLSVGVGFLPYIVLAIAYAWEVVSLARQARFEPRRRHVRGELVVLRPQAHRARPAS